MPPVLAVTSCPFCGAATLRLQVGGVVRAVDAAPALDGSLEVNVDAQRAWPTKAAGPSYSGTRHHLHRDTCTDWRGPVGG